MKLRRPYTVTGLAFWLDTSRQTLLYYEVRPEFFDALKRAKQRVENYAEESWFDPKKPTNGVKFSLSNNFMQWAKKSESIVKVEKDGAAELAEQMIANSAKQDEAMPDAPARIDEAPTPDLAASGRGVAPEVLPPGVPDAPLPVPVESVPGAPVHDPGRTKDGVREDLAASGEGRTTSLRKAKGIGGAGIPPVMTIVEVIELRDQA
jgi:hypothetical protein